MKLIEIYKEKERLRIEKSEILEQMKILEKDLWEIEKNSKELRESCNHALIFRLPNNEAIVKQEEMQFYFCPICGKSEACYKKRYVSTSRFDSCVELFDRA